MKSTIPSEPYEDDLLPEYRFDYRKAKPNRFAAKATKMQITVTLDPDVAAVFTSAESVNKVLRALIKTMPMSAMQDA